MDEWLWNLAMTATQAPPWPCPECKSGILVLTPDSIVKHETENSRSRDDGTGGWHPGAIEFAFTAWLKCAVARCGQMVALAGKGGLEPDWDEEL